MINLYVNMHFYAVTMSTQALFFLKHCEHVINILREDNDMDTCFLFFVVDMSELFEEDEI